jgi:hypothetical protein
VLEATRPRVGIADHGDPFVFGDAGLELLDRHDDLATQGADGIVTLNGQTLMQPRATTGEVGPRHITVDVTLLSANVLEVRLVGRTGSQLKITVTRKYEASPTCRRRNSRSKP